MANAGSDLWAWLSHVDWTLSSLDTTRDWIALLSIPIFTGVIGWLINLTGLWMLFAPLHFHGIRVPGLAKVTRLLPRPIQEIPGLLTGGLGWQGIVPARAGKMGSIAVDKAIAKIGSTREFYEQLDPEQIAEHIVRTIEPDLYAIVEEVMIREQPALWRDLPPAGRQALIGRVRTQLPKLVRTITDEIGQHIDLLLDPKLMVIEHFQNHPELVVRVFRDIGQHELRMMVNFGFIFGFLLGVPVALLDHWFHQVWLLPVLGVIVGWITNKLGMWLIFEPLEPTRILGFRFHGLFLRRRDEAAEIYARLIAEEVITLEQIGDFLLEGPRADRTRRMMADALKPAIDRAVGPLRGFARVAMGPLAYDTIRSAFADEAANRTIVPLRDPEFSKVQSERMRAMFAERTAALPPADFVEMMRAAFREDEWMLYAHGALMGFLGGLLHLAIFGVGGG